MFFRKKRKNDVTELFVNGGIPAAAPSTATGQDRNPRDIDPLAILRSSGINTDLIPASLLPTIASSLAMNTDESNDHAKIKVDCESCNRQVAYGKGKCMYCGKPLELPFSVAGPDVSLDGPADAGDDSSGGSVKTTTTGVDFDVGGSL